MRELFPGRVLESLRGDLVGQVTSASACIGTFLDYNLQHGVDRNLLAARREMQRVQASIAAAITVAELEGNRNGIQTKPQL